MIKKIIYNTGSQIIGKAATASITLLVSVLIGRSLGPSGYGDFTKIFVFVGYFYTVGDLGLNSIFVKLADKKNLIKLLSSLVGLRLIVSLLLLATAVIIGFLLPYNRQSQMGFTPLVKMGILIAAATIVTQALFTTANAYFQKILRYDLSTLAALSGYLVILALTAVITATSGSLLAYVAAYVAGGIILVLVAYTIIAKKLSKVVLPSFSPKPAQKMIKFSWPVGLALIFNLIYFRIDVLIMSYTRPTYEVGLYGLSYQFFEAALAIPIFFANALYPVLIHLKQSSQSDFRAQVNRWLMILTLIGFLITAGLIVASLLIAPIFGQRFLGSVPSLQILSLGMPLFFISALLWHLLIIGDKQRRLIYIYAAGALFNVVVNLILIPAYGYLVAAITTVLSEALITLLLALSLRSTTPLKLSKAGLL